MSVAWLTFPRYASCGIRDLPHITVIEVADQGIEVLAGRLTGYEIVITGDVPLEEILRRCRWIRGAIGVGPDVCALLDWSGAERRGLLIARIEANGQIATDRIRTVLTNMDRHLRSLDEIAERWEGT